MDVTLLLTLLIVILGVLFLLALIFPARFTAWGGSTPGRGKAFVYLLAAVILFFVLGAVYEDPIEKMIRENPEGVTELTLSEKGLTAFPEYLDKLVNLEELNLERNELTEIDPRVRNLKKLRWLILDVNPISTIPDWLLELENLTIVGMYSTNIDSSSLPILNSLIARGVDVRFDETYITGKTEEVEQTEETEDAKAQAETSDDDPHAESFAEFAKRRLLGGRDTDHRRKYGKGEIFYKSGIEHALLDSLGYTLTDLGLFTPEKEVSVKLVKESDGYQLKIVTIYDKKEEIEEEIRASWQLMQIVIAARVFEDAQMEIHLCDDHWEVLEIIKSE
jgi:hypothetical protein